jgi:hypothetical protein
LRNELDSVEVKTKLSRVLAPKFYINKSLSNFTQNHLGVTLIPHTSKLNNLPSILSEIKNNIKEIEDLNISALDS